MRVRFLGQGLQQEGASAGSVLVEGFQNPQFRSFTAFVAFAGVSGVELLSDYILAAKAHITEWHVFVGIDLKGTSKEALEALLGLDIETKIYHTPTQVTYHPKIYIFEGEQGAKLLIGSSNMTEKGLFSNVEASLVVDIDFPDETGSELIQQVKDYFVGFLSGETTNVQPLSQLLIEKLKAARRIPDENERKQRHEREREDDGAAGEADVMQEIKQLFPSTRMQKVGIPRKKKFKEPIRVAPLNEFFDGVPEPDAEEQGFDTFLLQLNKLQGASIPGEIRIPIAARDFSPDFWGWEAEYREIERNRGSMDRKYVEWKPVWLFVSQTGEEVTENARLYLYLESMDFRLYSRTLVGWGADESDIVKISRGGEGAAFTFRCELVKKGTPEFNRLITFCTESVRNSTRKYGFI